MRVPTPNVSVVDLVADLDDDATADEVNDAFKEAAAGDMEGILDYVEAPLVSHDFLGDPHSSIVDGLMTAVLENSMVKVISWYDNEWGYSNRLIDLVPFLLK